MFKLKINENEKKKVYFLDVGTGSEITALQIEMTTCYTNKRAMTTRQERWRLPFRKRAVNLCKTWRLLTFTGVHQSENPWFSNCFTVGEFEYSFHYPVVSLCGERWKTLVFWNLPDC